MSLNVSSGLSGSGFDWASAATINASPPLGSAATNGSAAISGSAAVSGSAEAQSSTTQQALQPVKLPQPVMKIPTQPLSPSVLAELIGRQLSI